MLAGFKDHITGGILYNETLYQKDKNGKPLAQIINEAGAVAEIKVDSVLALVPNADD